MSDIIKVKIKTKFSGYYKGGEGYYKGGEGFIAGFVTKKDGYTYAIVAIDTRLEEFYLNDLEIII